MWHEARKQERRIRGMLVDYRKRAERRRDFYEKIKADPTQFLQLHGRQCKIHLDPAVAAAADSAAAMMPWQGHSDNLIDRFDVRAHLDFIPPLKKIDDEEITYDERQLNYERYRIIAQNSFLGITEEKFLKQLHLEEQFGYTEAEPKKKKATGAAIGFNYEDGTGTSQPVQPSQGNSSDEQSDSDLDVDLSINVSKMDSTQAHEMNRHGRNFGMSTNDFYSFLTNDLEEAENYRLAKEEEHEKALFSGRKSRRERRCVKAHREKRLANRVISPPSYAARTSPTYPLFRESKSASKSPSPENTGKITYITSFGGEDEPTSSTKPSYADKVKYGKPKRLNENPGDRRTVYIDPKKRAGSKEGDRFSKRARTRSPDLKNRRSRSPNRYRRSRSRNRSRRYRSRKSISSSSSRSASRSRRRDRSNSKSLSKYQSRPRNRSYTRSRSGSGGNCPQRSRSRSKSKNVSRSESRSQSNPVPKSSSRSSSSSNSSETPTNVPKSVSRSRSSSTKSSISVERSRSRSGSQKKESPPKVIPRYYGRKRSDQSSSDLSESEDDEEKDIKPEIPVTASANKSSGNSGTTTKKSNASLSLQERLKRKRQAQLNKQFKADKMAEQLKTEREKQEQQNREDEIREMSIKLRRWQRERRHAYDSNSSSSSDSETRPRSAASASEGKRSKSPSPRIKRDDRDFKLRELKYRYRDNSRERSREREGSGGKRSPKSRHDPERRLIYRDDADREKAFRRRDEAAKDARRDRDRDSFKSKEPGRSLVDY